MDGIDFEKVIKGCLEDCQKFLQEGIKQVAEIEEIDPDDLAVKEEFGINSRYLPRGFYCPSKMIEYYITNMRRGKIAQRKTKKPTHRFLFNKDGQLFFVERFFDTGAIGEEYVFYKDNVAYGIECERYSNASCCYIINVAVYDNGKISSFLWVPVVEEKEDHWDVSWIHYETYDYKEENVIGVNVYSIKKSYKGIDIASFIERNEIPNTSSSLIECQKMLFYTDENANIDPKKIDWVEGTQKIVDIPLSFR